MNKADVEDLMTLAEMLLKFIYEFPSRVRAANRVYTWLIRCRIIADYRIVASRKLGPDGSPAKVLASSKGCTLRQSLKLVKEIDYDILLGLSNRRTG